MITRAQINKMVADRDHGPIVTGALILELKRLRCMIAAAGLDKIMHFTNDADVVRHSARRSLIEVAEDERSVMFRPEVSATVLDSHLGDDGVTVIDRMEVHGVSFMKEFKS